MCRQGGYAVSDPALLQSSAFSERMRYKTIRRLSPDGQLRRVKEWKKASTEWIRTGNWSKSENSQEMVATPPARRPSELIYLTFQKVFLSNFRENEGFEYRYYETEKYKSWRPTMFSVRSSSGYPLS
jgi:hypothetical protein